jgi:hypothetical protein
MEEPRTAYMASKQKLHIKKALQARAKYLCNLTGMAPDAAERQAKAELADGSSEWVKRANATLPS